MHRVLTEMHMDILKAPVGRRFTRIGVNKDAHGYA